MFFRHAYSTCRFLPPLFLKYSAFYCDFCFEYFYAVRNVIDVILSFNSCQIMRLYQNVKDSPTRLDNIG